MDECKVMNVDGMRVRNYYFATPKLITDLSKAH